MVNNATPELILQPPFQHGGGSQWTAYLPPSYAEPSDSNDAPAMSRLRLWENGKPLGPRHAFHAAFLQDYGAKCMPRPACFSVLPQSQPGHGGGARSCPAP